MSLKTFISSLVPHFERSRVIEDIDSLSNHIEKDLLPNYGIATQQLRGKKFASNPVKAMEALYDLRNPRDRGISHLQYISRVLANAKRLLEALEAQIPELFARDITKDALTYKRAAVLQLLAVIRFYSDYAASYLHRAVSAEAAVLKGGVGDEGLDPIDRKFLDEQLESFFQAGHLLDQKVDGLIERLGSMEDIQIVSDKINFVATTMGQDVVDPLRLGFMGVTATASPVYKFRSMVANWQDATYKRNVELAKATQLRLYALRDAKAGKNDPLLEQKIGHLEGRLGRLRQDVADYEARYAS